MKFQKRNLILVITLVYLLTLLLIACKSLNHTTTSKQTSPVLKASNYNFPQPVDTYTKTIVYQEKKIYDVEKGVYATNDFPAARLNEFRRVNDTLLLAQIHPENYPINNSPWYAFKLWSEDAKEVYLSIEYVQGKHRYLPKLSQDGLTWKPIDDDRLFYNEDSTGVTCKLAISTDTLWISAQEIYDSKRTKQWCQALSEEPGVQMSIIGKSKLGRDLYFMDINVGEKKSKNIIVLFSRQHPPEVTGFFAMQAFVKGLLTSPLINEFLIEYRILVYPLLNPDGVDLGHWRHNAGGVDLNRDWAYYRQPETRAVADHLVGEVIKADSKVVLGFDFHSTYYDVYYTQDKATQKTPTTPWFREAWFKRLEERLPGYKVNEKAAGLRTPVTKGWFYTQFGIEGMTYEIGDDTPRDSIKIIGKVSAEEMISILLRDFKQKNGE